jgi:hypothetical protein
MVGEIAPGLLQPETAITAKQQLANLVAGLRESNKAKTPTAMRWRERHA